MPTAERRAGCVSCRCRAFAAPPPRHGRCCVLRLKTTVRRSSMKKLRWPLCFSAALLLTAPALSLAHSGRESRGAEWLQEHLRPGRSPEAYRRMLHDMGKAVQIDVVPERGERAEAAPHYRSR